jgi:hypothetical protein
MEIKLKIRVFDGLVRYSKTFFVPDYLSLFCFLLKAMGKANICNIQTTLLEKRNSFFHNVENTHKISLEQIHKHLEARIIFLSGSYSQG